MNEYNKLLKNTSINLKLRKFKEEILKFKNDQIIVKLKKLIKYDMEKSSRRQLKYLTM